jgi:hypothetical protein
MKIKIRINPTLKSEAFCKDIIRPPEIKNRKINLINKFL